MYKTALGKEAKTGPSQINEFITTSPNDRVKINQKIQLEVT
jgi:hypothetical protein